MRKIIIMSLGLYLIYAACSSRQAGSEADIVRFKAFKNTTIRAMAVRNDSTVWVGGPSGMYAVTRDGGSHWEKGTIPEAGSLDFRSIALPGPNSVLLMTAGSPALIFKSDDQGKSWRKVYADTDSLAFFNSMAFSDSLRGIAFGDVKDGCFNVLTTSDGGDHWERIPCSSLPVPQANEVAFASSNTCIDTYGDKIWIGTGGESSRILYSPDFGVTWEAYSTPMIQGNTMTGIYSLDFYNDSIGIAVGGDYENQTLKQGNKIRTSDGGETWERLAEGQLPAYLSCVQFASGSSAEVIYAAGHGGLYRSKDGGYTWENLMEGDLTTIRESEDGAYIWFAGIGVCGKIKVR